MSLPLRECGLKYLRWLWCLPRIRVTPLAGVWIEIKVTIAIFLPNRVTPLAGVWIEIIPVNTAIPLSRTSLPLRECGLKYISPPLFIIKRRHSPCGSVD